MDAASFMIGFMIGNLVACLFVSLKMYIDSLIRKHDAETEHIKWVHQREKEQEPLTHFPSKE